MRETIIPTRDTITQQDNVFTKEQLERVKLAIDAAIRIQTTTPEVVFGRPGGGPVMCDIVDAVIFVAEVVLATYAFTKWNQYENPEFFQQQLERIKALDYKARFSLRELVAARAELNALGER